MLGEIFEPMWEEVAGEDYIMRSFNITRRHSLKHHRH